LALQWSGNTLFDWMVEWMDGFRFFDSILYTDKGSACRCGCISSSLYVALWSPFCSH
jgi:hypothetical protein